MSRSDTISLSVVIPTFCREEVLLDTVRSLFELKPSPSEILLIDQTPAHCPETDACLSEWRAASRIRHIKFSPPSITHAMNVGLVESRGDLVLFLDDDIVPKPGLIAGHCSAHSIDRSLWATVGQVIQPWQSPEPVRSTLPRAGLYKDLDFPFHSTLEAPVENVMAGNLCVRRDRALSIGGFDEHFVAPAYRFETDFARRVISAGGSIRFLGSAGISHLRAESGGTRAYGNHLTSASPMHGFGDYYYAFQHAKGREAWLYSLKRLFREVRTRFHLTHPWWIPVKLTGEIRALISGRRQARKGPKLLTLDGEA